MKLHADASAPQLASNFSRYVEFFIYLKNIFTVIEKYTQTKANTKKKEFPLIQKTVHIHFYLILVLKLVNKVAAPYQCRATIFRM